MLIEASVTEMLHCRVELTNPPQLRVISYVLIHSLCYDSFYHNEIKTGQNENASHYNIHRCYRMNVRVINCGELTLCEYYEYFK